MFVFVCFIQLVIALFYFNSKNTTGEIIIKSALLFSGFIVVLVETLSLFKAITLTSLIISWSLFSIIILFFLIKKRKEFIVLFINRKQLLQQRYKSFSFYEKIILWVISLFVLMLLFQGIIYPPNNWDSLTYHMSRIMYWIGNQSVSHFPTHILRHVYQPPFAEYFVLNLNLLNGNDYFSNNIQLLYLVFTFFSIWLLLNHLAIPRLYKLLAIFIAITIPAVELQASTTKNDIVCSFFILSTIVFCFKSYHSKNFSNFFFLGLAIGLAMLTKGTAYIFLAPILLIFGIFLLVEIFKTKDLRILLNGLATILIILSLNGGHYIRNYKIDGNILNIDKNEAAAFSNQKMNGKLLLSNLMKNTGLHLGYPVETKSDTIIRKLHSLMDVPIDNPDTNYYNVKYDGPKENTTNEDLTPNLVHLILLSLSLIVLLFSCFKDLKRNIPIALLIVILLSQIVFFAAFLKWQPWHTRLHIPIFLLSVVLITLAINKSKWFRYCFFISIPFLLFSFYFYFTYNNIRPIKYDPRYTKGIKISDTRYKKYFAHQPQFHDNYKVVLHKMDSLNVKKVGLMISDWEYPLLSNSYYNPLQVIAINVNNITGKITQDETNVEAIISNSTNLNSIEFKGEKYSNQTPQNTYLWLYK